jgi:hypothetical protein
MLKIISTLLGFSLLGALFAANLIHWPLRPGYIGAGLLVGLAVLARRYWQSQRLSGNDPSLSARRVWLYLAGTAMICGYVIIVLATPGAEVHRATGDTGGFDTWLMLAGGLVAYAIVYDGKERIDERDLAIEAIGKRVGHTTLVVLLLLFLLMLGFAPRVWMQRFTHWLIANSLLTLIMLSCLAQYTAQLICYWRDAQAIADHNSSAA